MNKLGVLKIYRHQACGSMAERMSVWKRLKHGEYCDGFEDDAVYTEFDFIAVLGEFQDQLTKRLSGMCRCRHS